jgi:hypothetical protein
MTLGARDDFDASANVVLGYHLAGGGARDLAVELVGSAYLRQRFFDEIREERQLAYAPQVELVQFSDTHRLEFSTHVSDQGNLPQIIGVCNALIDELRRPDPALVLAARDARAHALEVDSAEDLSRAMKLAWLTRRRGETPGALLDALTRVDAAALAEFASRNFEDDQRFVISDSALAGGAMSVWMIAALLVLFLVFTDAWRGFPLFRGAAQRWSAWKHRPRSARPRESRKRAPRDRIVPIDVDELERSIQRHFDDLDHK